MKKSKYSEWTKEELIKRVDALEKRKKYGLVWDEEKTKEKFETEAEGKFPVLKEIKSKEIKTDPEQLTHILIEGDNYHALSVLNYTHEKAIDVIYIDPPYNTGAEKEWKYNDKWVDKNDSYRHSKWLSFLAKRINLAKNLLNDKGVIFISIDDNEYAQLKLLCDEIFTEDRFIGTLVWEKKKKGSHLDVSITNIKEYVLVYCKNKKHFNGLIGQVATQKETYPCINPGNTISKRIIPKGIKSNFAKKNYRLKKGAVISSGNMKLVFHGELIIEDGILKKDVEVEAEWRYTQHNINEYAKKGSLYITRELYFRHEVIEPRYKKLKDLLLRTEKEILVDKLYELVEELEKNEKDEEKIDDIKNEIKIYEEGDYQSFDLNNLYTFGWGSNEDGDNELRDLFGEKVFDYPKPIKLIQKLIAATNFNKAIVLDFFAGTGTTAQAVLNLNAISKNYQFILCTNNEDNNDNGLKIAEDICYPRIKKSINGYKKRNGEKISGYKQNMKYYKTAFVPQEPTDKNKELLTREAEEMLCLRENTFELVLEKVEYKIFKNDKKYLGIIWEQLAIDNFKKEVNKYSKPISVYVFSLADEDFSEEFADMRKKIKVCSIPEAILRVYRRIFK